MKKVIQFFIDLYNISKNKMYLIEYDKSLSERIGTIDHRVSDAHDSIGDLYGIVRNNERRSDRTIESLISINKDLCTLLIDSDFRGSDNIASIKSKLEKLNNK